MSIIFNDVPADAQLNNNFIEVTKDKQRLGLQTVPQTIGLIGQGLTGSSFSNGEKREVFSADEIGALYGYGSEIHNASKYLFQNAGSVSVVALPLKEDGGDTASAGSILFSGTVSTAGNLTVTIAGQIITIVAAVGDTAEGIVDKIVAANPTDSVGTLVKNATPEKLDITSKWKGATGDDITISVSDVTLVGLTDAVITAMTGGVGVPDVDLALNAVSEDEIMTVLVHPYTDTANLTKVEAWESVRWASQVKKGFVSFTAKRGNYATVVTGLTGTRNSWTSAIVGNQSPELSISVAAGVGGVVARRSAIDPSLQFNNQVVKGLTVPNIADRWDWTVRDAAIKNGCAVLNVVNSKVVIDMLVNTYQTNAQAAPAPQGDREVVSNTLMIAIVYDYDVALKTLWTGAKLANDGVIVPSGQKVMTPETMKAFILGRYQLYLAELWVEEVAIDGSTFADTIITERDLSNANRINAQFQILRIGNMRISALKIGWDFAI